MAAALAVLMRRLCLLLLVLTSCKREALAQNADPALGPIACFEQVSGLVASQTGIELCRAATSATPGQCFVEASRRATELTTNEVVVLCAGATSLDPLDCYERLQARGTVTENQAIGYCAPQCPIGPAPAESSSAACIGDALDRTELAEQTAGELCRSSRSALPVECYLRGETSTQLSDSQLVDLCQQNYSCQYVNAAAPY
jgi:hypothetical protein